MGMRVLILGGAGMLGHKVWQVLARRFDAWATVRESYAAYADLGVFDPGRTIDHIDATDDDALRRAFEVARPDVLVNCVGIVKQRAAGRDPIACITVNALLPHRLARLCRSSGCRLVHISTDCVFSGRQGMYTEGDAPDAEDLYGRSKLLGEPHASDPAALTLRTSIVGRELRGATGVTEWLLSQRGRRVPGYRRAVFSGLSTAAFARILGEVIEEHPALAGLYHVASPAITKYDLLTRLNAAFDAGVDVEPSDDVVIDRSLDGSRFWRATGLPRPEWDAMIAEMAQDPTPYGQWKGTHVS